MIKTILQIFSIFAFPLTIIICNESRGYISKETERKYLRNIHIYYALDEGHITEGISGGDSLTFMATALFHQITPGTKWYISDVGNIRRASVLSRKLDSIASTYIDPAEKYK